MGGSAVELVLRNSALRGKAAGGVLSPREDGAG